jgi:CO dehydrogenase maturation factor
MRIAFMGKGGSGKTTIAASFISYLSNQGKKVLGIDADVNKNLGDVLSFTQKPLPLSENFAAIAYYLEGNRQEIKNLGITKVPSFGSIPPSLSSVFIHLHEEDDFLETYSVGQDGIRLLDVGKHSHDDFSNTCYHAKLNSLEITLHHLLDTKDEYVVVDSTAGIDSLGTSLFMSYDLTIFVVEPTLKSINVFLEYQKATAPYGLNVKALINKVSSDGDKTFVLKHMNQEDIVGYVSESSHIYKLEQGDRAALNHFVTEYETLFDIIINESRKINRDWTKYLDLLKVLFKRECDSWWSKYYDKDLLKIIDPKFTYAQVI